MRFRFVCMANGLGRPNRGRSPSALRLLGYRAGKAGRDGEIRLINLVGVCAMRTATGGLSVGRSKPVVQQLFQNGHLRCLSHRYMANFYDRRFQERALRAAAAGRTTLSDFLSLKISSQDDLIANARHVHHHLTDLLAGRLHQVAVISCRQELRVLMESY